MKPRDYQIRTLDEIWEALQIKLNSLIKAPCSAGKTILFSKIIQRLIRENPSFRALILVDREILVTQSAEKLARVAPELSLSIGVVCASVSSRKDVSRAVTVASRQSLIGQLGKFPPVQICICDEAHLMAMPHDDKMIPDQYAEIINKLREYNQNMRLLGCTASPYRLGSKGGYIYGDQNREDCHPYFDKIDSEITTAELLHGGYIAPLVGHARVSDGFIDDIKSVSLVGGEYNLGQLSGVMCRSTHIKSCVDAWKEYASDRKKTLVFCTSIEHAEAVAESFNKEGIGAIAIHSKLGQIESAAAMQSLEQGTRKVFTSVAKLTTGMDVVDIDCIIMARPTKSTALYQQCIGRGQRLAEGKTDCLVLDLVGCTTEFGTDMDNLIVKVPRGVGDGETPVKVCPGTNNDGTICGQSVHASLKYCPHCAFEFPVTEEVEAAIGKLKKIEFNKLPDPETWDVSHVMYQRHVSKSSGKELIKITYECGQFETFSEYRCLPDYYDGRAVDMSKEWWHERSNEIFPETVEEFIFLSGNLLTPAQIVVQKEGKFNRVIDYKFVEHGDVLETELGYQSFQYSSTGDDVPF